MAGLETQLNRVPGAGQPRVIAIFSYRYDAHLVPALIENLADIVHGWAAFDDRAATAPLSDEPARRNLLLAAARDMGADWILAVDPDERFETALAARIDQFTAAPRTVRWRFDLREMFTPTAYRTDGLWGHKKQTRLFACPPAPNASPAVLHGSWIASDAETVLRDTDINLYHLNMISPERRRQRRDLYAAADPERLHQVIGYDYLADDRGAVLEEIPRGRGFHPPHHDDGRCWSPRAAFRGTAVPDSTETRLHLIARLRTAGDPAGVFRVVRDLADAAPEDGDLHLLAAAAALDMGQPDVALAAAEAAAQADPQGALAHIFQSRALAGLDRPAPARAAAQTALRRTPDSLLARQQSASLQSGTMRFAAPDALWRRWVSGSASLHEGAGVAAEARLAVVVLGYGAPREMREAVASVCAQEPAAEIVVVNSGGGDPRRLLADHLDRIRLIEVAERLFVGAARNIGIDASAAPFVAFLAADCLAEPGWIAERLALHHGGAEAVSTPVVPHRPRNPFSGILNAILHRRRGPDTPDSDVAHYGVSYARPALVRTGYFPPALRVSEDSVLNGWLRKTAAFHYGRRVTTRHRYPTGLAALLRDAHARGMRRVPHPPFTKAPGDDLGAEPDWEARAQDSLAAALTVPEAAGMRGWRLAVWRRLLWWTIRADQRGTRRAWARARAAEQLRERAAAVAAADDPGAARRLADRALALNPQNMGCLMLCARLRLDGLAKARDNVGEREEAIALLRRAMALRPHDTRPLAALCTALKAAGRLTEAVDAAEFSALSAPRIAQHWELAGKLAAQAGQHRRSRMMMQMALVCAPQRATPHRSLASRYDMADQATLSQLRGAMGERLQVIQAQRKARR